MSRATPLGDADDRRKGVGSLLRASRLRCGEELEDVAQVLRIRRRHIQAIEDGDFASLPGTTYAVGFIRAYADYLGLDSDEVVRRFKEGQATETSKQKKNELSFPSPMSESGVPRGAVVFLGIIIGLIVYGGWYTSTVDNDFFERWIEPVPARLAALLPGGSDAPAVSAENQTTPAPESGSPSAPQVDQQAPANNADTLVSKPDAEPSSEATVQNQMESSTRDASTQSADPVSTSVTAPSPGTQTVVTENPEIQPSNPGPSVESVQETVGVAGSQIGAQPSSSVQASAAVTAKVKATPAATPLETPKVEIARIATTIPAAQPIAGDPRAPNPVESAGALSTGTADTAATMSAPPPVSGRVVKTTPASTMASAPTDTAKAPTSSAVAAATSASDSRIVVTAISDSWVEIRELVSDEWVWGKLLKTGESYEVPNRDDLKLKSGNAGGLTITVDGTSVPAIGASGEVVRNVLLDPVRLKAGRAVFR